MGEKARRKAAFLEEHSRCCYCGGNAQATTIDHNPARSLFPIGGAPKDFCFPACSPCNGRKRKDESRAALVFNTFNINEPVSQQHADLMLSRTRGFLLRDENFRAAMQTALSRDDALIRPAVTLPDEYQTSVVLIGTWLFQALYYRFAKSICRADQHILVRRYSNQSMEQDGDEVRPYLQLLNGFVPATTDPNVSPRFGFGARVFSDGIVGLGAEIAGSTVWIGVVQPEPPDAELRNRFVWFSGTGEFLGEPDAS